MNKRIEGLWWKARIGYNNQNCDPEVLEKFAELIVEATLTQVADRAYYSGDRAWSDELDRPWIQLEFGYGPLAEMKK